MLITFKFVTQSSGSDIVVEEDLAEIFGRLTITPNLAASFRNLLSRPAPPSHLVEKVALYAGPGPTVRRAMKEAPYFSTVLQCECSSVSIHPLNSGSWSLRGLKVPR